MHSLTMFFLQRKFFLSLWNNDKLLHKSIFEDASKLLLSEIDKLLDKEGLKMTDLKNFYSISGPGSFSSIRVAYSTLLATKKVFSNLNCASYYVNELISDDNIILKLNNNIYLVCENEKWNTVLKKDLDLKKNYVALEEYDLDCNIKIVSDIEKNMILGASKKLKEPLYVYMPVKK